MIRLTIQDIAMILSSKQVRHEMENDSIKIEPFEETSFKEASYTFHLGERLFVFPKDQIIDIEQKELIREEVFIGEDGFILEPNAFVVGQLQETLTVDETVAAFLSVRGSCAQAGLNALNSDFFAEPAWGGQLALAIKNMNHVPIRLHTGMKIVKGIFFKIKTVKAE
ncbi:hypothetical protein KBB27_03315 [Patescibacteria group bacterium]|nr:hypothetical protein [Patescibacteria group bacterium]